MNILGLKVTAHDTGAALIAGEKVIAISEERLCRVKHSPSIFPHASISYCLAAAGIADADVDLVVIDQTGNRSFKDMRALFYAATHERFRHVRVEVINHHDAHAASAFFASPFDEAAVLVVDGAGEKIQTHLGVLATETETLYRGSGNELSEIRKTMHIRRKSMFPFTFGPAKMYSLISESYLNMGQYNEGKMMGLAPYGDESFLKAFPLHRWLKEMNGHMLCNAEFNFEGGMLRKKREKKIVTAIRALFERLGFNVFNYLSPLGVDTVFRPRMFEPLNLPRPARRNEPLPDAYYASVARAAQMVFEEAVLALAKQLKTITGSENLVVSGGAALNIDTNKRFLDDAGFRNLFIQPAASDSGIPLGCALWGAHMILGLPRFWEMKSASLGRSYTDEEVSHALETYKNKITVRRSSAVAVDAAKLIASGKIIGWFQGGSEYGPRALGNRSILGDARNPEMANIINKKVKHREPWRPFAASILTERQREWFELDHPSPFMLLAAPVVLEKRKIVPSIVHVDGSCRIQSVTREAHESYYELLKAFEAKTGVPLVLNTSFNDAGEPMVETPEDALRCFLHTEMDALVLHDYIVTKPL